MILELESWEDGAPVKQQLNQLDRWAVQAAHTIVFTCGDVRIKVEQKPQMLSGKKLGVAAVLWDGAFVLAGYLAGLQPRQAWEGRRVVELGAGVGLLGCLVAKWGAQSHRVQVVMTDKEVVLPLLRTIIAANEELIDALLSSAEALEWGAAGWQERAASLREPPIDYIVAADCVYIDQDGATQQSGSHVKDFVQACAQLASGRTTCFVAFECRGDAVRKEFLSHAQLAFQQVELLAQDSVSKGFQADHVELYQLKSPACNRESS